MALYYDEILAGNCFGQINMTHSIELNETVVKEDQSINLAEKHKYSIDELFHNAQLFLKEKQGTKDVQLKYNDNIRLIALSKQAKIGNWNASYTENIGFLDFVGNDRKQAWMSLENMSKEKAMEEYVQLVFDCYPSFRSFLQSQFSANNGKTNSSHGDELRRVLDEQVEQARQYETQQIARFDKQNRKRQELKKKQIQNILNQQTYSQFKSYAEQQYKNNPLAQEELIRQLQEQHFQQYMQQVYQQQLTEQLNQPKTKMEQQQPENTTGSSVSIGEVASGIASEHLVIPSPLPNVTVDTAIIPNITLINQTVPILTFPNISELPPLESAPSQLPPIINPPVAQSVKPATVENSTIEKNLHEPVIPIETLNLNTSHETNIAASIEKPSANIVAAEQFASVDIDRETNLTQEPNNNDSTDHSSLPCEETKPPDATNMPTANLWTRKDIKEFKDQLRKEKDAVLKIGSGETVTIRVPTHEDGNCLFWEFATDYYDLGFGAYFEWSKAQSNTITVHISDSSDEEENEDGTNADKTDIEKGSGSTNKPPKPPQTEIVPIYRRDCHEEVNAGSHMYPGHGVYLLKFDNSYSLWRSKTLYYRVYYSK